jgi:Domain of unknown function (DUF4350)
VSWLTSVDRNDKMLLMGCGVLVAIFILMLALFSPAKDNEDPTPSSYSTAPHGAKAAYELLRQTGYHVERQSEPLAQIEDRVDQHSTVVFAEPFLQNVDAARESVQAILEKGGRVLVTGYPGGLLVPGNAVQPSRLAGGECDADANGFGELAGSGAIRIAPDAQWKPSNPLHEVEYTCHGQAVVVTYKVGKGLVIWWADSSPLENSGIQSADNLVFFLNSIGPAETTSVFWDESLHGDSPSLLSYTRGTPLELIGWQLALVAALLLWSQGRRNGPLRPDPTLLRTTPIEFVHSLGSLYQASAASQTAVNDAYQYFRQRLERRVGIPQTLAAKAPAMSVALTQQFGAGAQPLQQTLVACEEAREMEKLSTQAALSTIQALHDCDDLIDQRMQIHPGIPGMR